MIPFKSSYSFSHASFQAYQSPEDSVAVVAKLPENNRLVLLFVIRFLQV